MAIACVIAGSRPVDAQKARKTVHPQFAMDNVQSVPLELLICHLFQRNHRRISRIQFTGFGTLHRRTPTEGWRLGVVGFEGFQLLFQKDLDAVGSPNRDPRTEEVRVLAPDPAG